MYSSALENQMHSGQFEAVFVHYDIATFKPKAHQTKSLC